MRTNRYIDVGHRFETSVTVFHIEKVSNIIRSSTYISVTNIVKLSRQWNHQQTVVNNINVVGPITPLFYPAEVNETIFCTTVCFNKNVWHFYVFVFKWFSNLRFKLRKGFLFDTKFESQMSLRIQMITSIESFQKHCDGLIYLIILKLSWCLYSSERPKMSHLVNNRYIKIPWEEFCP